MPYCTPDQIKSLIGAPIAWGEGLAPSELVVDDIIGRNSETIDGLIRNYYTVPFWPVPPLIESICIDLCLADLLPVIFHKNEEQIKRSSALRSWAMQRLNAIQAGQPVGGAGNTIMSTRASDDERIFTIDQDY